MLDRQTDKGRLPDEGRLLAGRYRLEERIGERGGSTAWRATDELLARRIEIRVFAPGSPHAAQAFTAARAASRLGHPVLARVLDADDRADPPYIVTEWPDGARLDRLLTAGPMSPAHAARTIAAAADGLAAAHQAGLAHLCLGPDTLWCGAAGEAKITGLAIDAALTGEKARDADLADTRGLARLLYAALTGCWPGTARAGLPAAPARGGRACPPREVRPRVPAAIDAVTCRALYGEAGDGGPILGPAQLAMELAGIAGAIPLGGGPSGPASAARPGAALTLPPGLPALRLRPVGKPRRRVRRVTVLAAVIAVLALLAVGGWLAARELAGAHGRTGTPHAAAAARALIPASVAAFGPGGEGTGDNPQLARYAIDGNPVTAWHTHWYASAGFVNLQAGSLVRLRPGTPADTVRERPLSCHWSLVPEGSFAEDGAKRTARRDPGGRRWRSSGTTT